MTAVPEIGEAPEVRQNGGSKVFHVRFQCLSIALPACRQRSSISALHHTGTEADLRQDGRLKLRFRRISAFCRSHWVLPSKGCNSHTGVHSFRAKQVFRPTKSGYEEGVITKNGAIRYQQVVLLRQLLTTVT